MASEIRVNKIINRSGLSTVTFSDTGAIVSGIVTANNFSGNLTGAVTGSGANLTSIPAGQLTGTVADARLTTVSSSKLSGALPAISGANLTGINTAFGSGTSVNTTGIITATAFVPTSQGALSNRNLIINGAMQVAQRGTSAASTGYQTVDRMNFGGSWPGSAITQSQSDVASGTTPYTLGFRKAYKIVNSSQSSAGAAYYIVMTYKTEAQDLATSGWNYKSASSYITVSFWVKSSVAQNFYVRFQTKDGGSTYNYPFETGSLTADTWTKVTHSIPGNSNLTIDNDNGEGPKIQWAMYRGSNDTSSSVTLNQWAAYSDGTKTPDYTAAMDDWFLTNGATFEITGVQLEVGPVATPFEHCSYAEEFRRCARYCYQWIDDQMLGFGQVYSGSGYVKIFPPIPVNMRAKPSVTKNAPTGYWFVSYQGNSGYAGDRAVTVEGNSGDNSHQSSNTFRLFVNGGSNQGNGTTVWCLMHDTAGAYLRLDAEL